MRGAATYGLIAICPYVSAGVSGNADGGDGVVRGAPAGEQLDNLPIVQLSALEAWSAAEASEANGGRFLEGEEPRGRTLEFEA